MNAPRQARDTQFQGRDVQRQTRDAQRQGVPRQGAQRQNLPRQGRDMSREFMRGEAGNRAQNPRNASPYARGNAPRDSWREAGAQQPRARYQQNEERQPGPSRPPQRGASRPIDEAFDPVARIVGSTGAGRGRGGAAARSFDFADAFQLAKYILIAAVAIVVVFFVGRAIYSVTPGTYSVAGEQMQINRGSTYRDLVDSGTLGVSKGNLVAVDGSILEEGSGDDPTVYLDGNPVNLDDQISDTGNITAENGADRTEPYTATQKTTAVETKIARDKQSEEEGAAKNVFNFYNGVLHVVTQKGQEGITETRTGETSGKTAEVEVQKNEPRVVENLHPVLSDDQKLVALTFDDGPTESGGDTDTILEVLDQYGAKATFFMLGSQAEANPEVAKRVSDAGHQVASHSYSHDAEHFLNSDKADDVREQVQKARDAIESAVGYAPSYIRPPGGNIDVKGIEAAGDLADGYIGWTVDPHDYDRPGGDVIAENILNQVSPGSIVLLHDGGGDRSQTIEAIKTVIPELQSQGYTFVTIDELVQAVLSSSDSSSSDSSSSSSTSDSSSESGA